MHLPTSTTGESQFSFSGGTIARGLVALNRRWNRELRHPYTGWIARWTWQKKLRNAQTA